MKLTSLPHVRPTRLLAQWLAWSGLYGLLVLLKWNTLAEPYYWDSMNYVTTTAAKWLDGPILPLPLPVRNSHPPLFFAGLALAWRILGESLLVSHLFCLAFGAISLFYTVRLGYTLYRSPFVGLAALALLLFYPLFFAQLGTVMLDLAVTATGVAAVYYYWQRNRWAYIVLASAMVLIKETGVVLVGCVFLFDLVSNLLTWRRRRKGTQLRFDLAKSMLLLVPVIFVIAWFLYFVGVSSEPFVTTYRNLSWHRYVFRRDLVEYFLVGNYLFLLSLPIGVYLIRLVRHQRMEFLTRPEALFLLFLIATLILYSVTADLPRYFLPVYPFWFVLAAAALNDLFSRRLFQPMRGLIVILAILLFLSQYQSTEQEPWRLDATLAYQDAIQVHQAAARFIEQNYSAFVVLTAWPLNEILSEPRNGYLNRPVKAVYVTKNFRANPNEKYLVLFSPLSDQPEMLKWFNVADLYLVRRFEKNGRWVELYFFEKP